MNNGMRPYLSDNLMMYVPVCRSFRRIMLIANERDAESLATMSNKHR